LASVVLQDGGLCHCLPIAQVDQVMAVMAVMGAYPRVVIGRDGALEL
jgi:hypothetical protein